MLTLLILWLRDSTAAWRIAMTVGIKKFKPLLSTFLIYTDTFLLFFAVLGVTRESSKGEISKAYRNLARKFHPDVQGQSVSKEEAEANFRRIATAYEVLRDDDSRVDYDYMVDHPEELYSHYYRYYRRRAAPNVDIRLVVAVCITIISAIQYYSAWDRYETAIKYLTTVQKYRYILLVWLITIFKSMSNKILFSQDSCNWNCQARKTLWWKLEQERQRQVKRKRKGGQGKDYPKGDWGEDGHSRRLCQTRLETSSLGPNLLLAMDIVLLC